MKAFLSVGNNTKYEAFRTRTGSHSTKGLQTGRSLLYDFQLEEDQLNSASEERKVLGARINNLRERIKRLRDECGLREGRQIKQYIPAAKKMIFKNSPKLSKKILKIQDLAREMRSMELRAAELKTERPEVTKRMIREEFIRHCYSMLDEATLNAIVASTRESLKKKEKETEK